jgi:hypothetical protein
VKLLDGDPAVEGLVELARRNLDGTNHDSPDGGFALFEDRMLARKRARSVKWVGAVALAAALPLAAFGFQRFYGSSSSALSYKVVNGAAGEGSRVLGGSDTHIQFSDGSEVRLEPGAQTRVEDLKEHGGRVDLEDGQAHVSIVKQPKTAWLIEAGPYEVRVTGTRFDVRWSARDQVFELTMQHGSVVVTGPGAREGVPLAAGQRVTSGVADGRFVVKDVPGWGSPPAPPPAGTEESISSANPGESVGVDAPPSNAAEGSSPAAARADEPRGQHAWRKLVALGNFRAVLEQAEQRGLERTLATAPLDALSALADAARYSRRADVARRALLAERQRFASSAPAREAAFFIGRIEEDAQGGAMEWYERYLAESPGGPYASQALGREMMLVYGKKGGASAASIARDYLARYPRGPYTSAAHKILDIAPAAHP